MPQYFRGSGTWQGLIAGGLPDAVITAAEFDGGQTGAAPGYLIRAWVYFDGSGNLTPKGTGNVTSLTDNNVGNYTLNFTTAMPDTNYAVMLGCWGSTGSAQRRTHKVTDVDDAGVIVPRTTSGTRLNFCDVNAIQIDLTGIAAVVIR
ncbi:hypothetical protein EBT31_15685 [bacterium]|jgi:hypothetical protein|nr:hypothetical protein [bacterium]